MKKFLVLDLYILLRTCAWFCKYFRSILGETLSWVSGAPNHRGGRKAEEEVELGSGAAFTHATKTGMLHLRWQLRSSQGVGIVCGWVLASTSVCPPFSSCIILFSFHSELAHFSRPPSTYKPWSPSNHPTHPIWCAHSWLHSYFFTPFRIISCMASPGWQLERLCSQLPGGGNSWPGAAPVAICPEWNSLLFSFRPFSVLCTCFFLKQFKLTAMTTTKSQERRWVNATPCVFVYAPRPPGGWEFGGDVDVYAPDMQLECNLLWEVKSPLVS